MARCARFVDVDPAPHSFAEAAADMPRGALAAAEEVGRPHCAALGPAR